VVPRADERSVGLESALQAGSLGTGPQITRAQFAWVAQIENRPVQLVDNDGTMEATYDYTLAHLMVSLQWLYCQSVRQ
jgi:hypothetical protein